MKASTVTEKRSQMVEMNKSYRILEERGLDFDWHVGLWYKKS